MSESAGTGTSATLNLDKIQEQMTYYGYAASDDLEEYMTTVSTSVKFLQIIGRKLLKFIDLRRLFIMVVVVLAFLFILFVVSREIAYYMAIKYSRCYKQKQSFSRGGTVSAIISKEGRNLMSVAYDLRAKMATTACLCNGGNTLNPIPYWRYDFKTKRVSEDSLNCMCDENYMVSPGALTIVGNDKLATFMYSASTEDAKLVFNVVMDK